YAFLIPVTDEAVPVDWDNAAQVHLEASQLEKEPLPDASFGAVPPAAMKKKSYAAWSRDFAAWITTSQSIELFRSPGLGRLSQPGESERNFRARLAQEARESRDEAAGKVRQKYAAKMATLEDRIRRAESMVQKEEAEEQERTINTAVDIGGALLGAFLGQRVSRRSIGRLRVKGTMDVERAADQLRSLQQQHWDLELAIQQEMNAVAAKMDVTTEQLERLAIRPKKTNVTVQLLALAWSPNALQKSE
ncbi:MAG: ATP-binding protein, partial [Bryobacteraceae bacterium]